MLHKLLGTGSKFKRGTYQAMIKSPSKYTTRSQLKALLANRCLGANGFEYSVEEVTELLIEKDTKLAFSDFKDDLDFQVEQYHAENKVNHWQVIRDFQEASFLPLELGFIRENKKECQEIMLRVEKDAGIIFPLIVSNSQAVIPSQTSMRGEMQRMKMKGDEITEEEAVKAVARAGLWLSQEIERLSQEIESYGSRKVSGKYNKKK